MTGKTSPIGPRGPNSIACDGPLADAVVEVLEEQKAAPVARNGEGIGEEAHARVAEHVPFGAA